jgi:hypothetical protein
MIYLIRALKALLNIGIALNPKTITYARERERERPVQRMYSIARVSSISLSICIT